MKRFSTPLILILAAVLCVTAAPLSADVKTREKVTFSLEGVLGGVVRLFGGRAAREGVESTVSLKGTRKATMDSASGTIVDLAEQKMYVLDMRRKEYDVTTFAQLREAFQKAKADAAKQKSEASPEEKEQMDQAARQLEFDAEVTETGQRKTLAGHETREVVLTITGREKGKTLAESGGFVLTNTMWIASRIAAVEELAQFELKFIKAAYGEEIVGDAQKMAAVLAAYPAFANMSSAMERERRKLDGTSLSMTTVFEGVKSEEQMKAAASQNNRPSGGGGLGGALGGAIGRRLGGNRQAQQRTKVFTTTYELLSVATTVAAEDVALPAGFKAKN